MSRWRWSIATAARSAATRWGPARRRAPPAAAAAAMVGGQAAFSDYGQDGSLYEFHLLPLASNSIFVVSAAGVADGWPGLVDSWGGFAAGVLALARAPPAGCG